MQKYPDTFRSVSKTHALNFGLLRQSVLYYFFLQVEPLFTPIYSASIANEIDLINE